MYNSISGKNRVVNVKPQGAGARTQEDIEKRSLNRETMKRLDFESVKENITDGRGRFSNEHAAYKLEISDAAKAYLQKTQTDEDNNKGSGQNQERTGLTKDASSEEDNRSIIQKVLDLQKDAQEKLAKSANKISELSIGASSEDATRPPDNTQRLTRMLVAARSTIQVQGVLSEAFNHMREWQRLAAEGDKKAIAVVKKLNKLVSRGNRKVGDLNKEQVMLQRQKKAEKAKQEQIARRLREELKQTELKRKQRERRYLQERDYYNENEPTEFGPSMAATEAKIRALAASMAALSTNSADTGAAGMDVSIAADGGGAEGAEASEGTAAQGDGCSCVPKLM